MGERTTLFIDGKVQKFGEVMDVFVAPDMRRQGIAIRLMQEVHTYFERRGYRGSILDPDTEASRRLYRKVGYQEITRTLRAQLRNLGCLLEETQDGNMILFFGQQIDLRQHFRTFS